MYNQFFGFRENPFNVTSDPEFLFMSDIHAEALSHMLYGIEYRKGFVTITGEIGTGKTTLCRSLIAKLNEKTKTSLIFNPMLSASQLIQAVNEDFGIEVQKRDKISLLRGLNSFLLGELKLGHNAVLIIDEAQNLSVPALEQIRLLSNLETEKEKLLQIILVGQPELNQKLNSPKLVQLKQRIAVKYHITSLSIADIAPYINFRLTQAGGTDQSIEFCPETIELIHKMTQGIPRLINLICDKSLLLAFVNAKNKIDLAMVENAQSELEEVLR